MKRLNTALILGLLFSAFCFAQTQTGNASYNASKGGFTIAHPSMSFGARVRITNLRNNSEVIASVDGRIPISDSRIADISKEAGDAIGMSTSDYTEVRLEQLVPQQADQADQAPSSVSAPVISPAPPPPPGREPAPAPQAQSTLVQAAQAPGLVQEPVFESVQVVSQPPAQYLPQYPFCVVILVLLILVVVLLTAIFILLLCIRRVPWQFGVPGPWYNPVWERRYLRYLKKRRWD
jgi:hypothetical protein